MRKSNKTDNRFKKKKKTWIRKKEKNPHKTYNRRKYSTVIAQLNIALFQSV